MSYIALYRKYRPDNFEDIVGQDHIIEILKNQIINEKISHAYIFSGTRGTGKTTAAKTFAKAVNCLNRKGAEPCNKCEACLSIISGSTTDVIEMDAASNNSVDNIRAIRQEVMYATTGLKYKIYIIDEVHMLSTSAFNALLKTLEEPPKNVIFILATTEEHKIIPTILSRCMRFEFKKINEKDIIKRLEYIVKDIGLKADKDALEYIAKLSNGGLRDALSILERLIDEKDSSITYSKVEKLVGAANKEVLNALVNAVIEYNCIEAMKITEDIIESGKEIRHICSQLVSLFIEKLKMEYIKDKKDKKDLSVLRLNYIIKEISKIDSDMRQSANSDIILKAKIIELCTKTIYSGEKDLLEKLEKLELRIEKLESGELEKKVVENTFKAEAKPVILAIQEEELQAPIKTNVNNITQENTKKNKDEKSIYKEIKKLTAKILEKDDLRLFSALETGTKVYQCDGSILFETKNKFAFDLLNTDKNRESLKQAVIDISGVEHNIKIQNKVKEASKENPFEEHMKQIDMPCTMID